MSRTHQGPVSLKVGFLYNFEINIDIYNMVEVKVNLNSDVM